MMYSDFHIHTNFSSDSETAPERQIVQGIALGMKTICITDHQDFDFPMGDLDFLFDSEEYFRVMPRLREKYAGQIDMRIGVELGLQQHLGHRLEDYVNQYPFDFVIGSTHISRNIDPYYPVFFDGISVEKAYRIYFEEELSHLKQYDCYDVVGHIDFVVRYGDGGSQIYRYEQYRDVLDEILRTAVEKGKGLECNTGGLRDGWGHSNPTKRILKRYREMGGEILTIGSDAHEPENLGYGFDRIGEFLKSCGFRYYTTFKKRKPEFHLL